VGIVRTAQAYPQISAILGTRFGILGVLTEDLVDLGREDTTALEQVGHTPSAALGTSRRRLKDDDAERVVAVLRAHGVRYFLYIGGNDSADTVLKVQSFADQAGYDLVALAVPKTIDNDLPCMDHTPGYGSIARYVAIATQDVGHDAAAICSTDQVTILEVMGRNAGWVAAASALGKTSPHDPPHLIYVPERPLRPEAFLQDVQHVVSRIGYCVVVVSETIRDDQGRPLARHMWTDGFGHARLVGAAERLCGMIERGLGLRARFNRPGTLQRSSILCVSRVDWHEAFLVGQAAVHHAMAGVRDQIITLIREGEDPYRCTTGLAPLTAVANGERRLPDHFLTDEGTMVTEAFVRYARPLIGDPLPSRGRLHYHAVPKRITG